MAFSYNPQDAKRTCLPDGTYDAELMSVTEKVSRAGEQMLEVIWTIPLNGKENKVKDFVLNPKTVFKLENIAKAWGEFQVFEEGRFDLAEHIRRQITLKLNVKSSPEFGNQNNVVAYLPASGHALPPRAIENPQPPTHAPSDAPDEMIPF